MSGETHLHRPHFAPQAEAGKALEVGEPPEETRREKCQLRPYQPTV